MKIEVSDLNERELHALMRAEGINPGVIRVIDDHVWLVYDARC